MRKLFIICFLIVPALFLYSQQSVFEYVEGEVSIKRISGDFVSAEIGDSLIPGDSVITGLDGFAELSLESSSKITINNDTVFVFSQREKKEEKKSIFMIVLGKIGFKFDRLLHEPDIQTPASIAGVRGTEFIVVSALDGSALYVVSEGSVAVESEGGLVVLETAEGVSVPLGETPGEKYEVKIGSEDFSAWLKRGQEEFLKNPTAVLSRISDKLQEYSYQAGDFYNMYEISSEELTVMREKLFEIGDEQGNEAKSIFYQSDVFPKEIQTSNLVLNYRFYALSALSLRRHVLGPMYVAMKTKYITDSQNVRFLDFLDEYERFLRIFEKDVVPYLVEADI
ncbi:MAG: hypothetical protein EH225_04215 [Calditrichaeota bacterium]|nr:MAG: hypothetical protein EH225_04215 [Calditrichota bacterium]